MIDRSDELRGSAFSLRRGSKWQRNLANVRGRVSKVANHGTPSRYSQGCRCADCTEAHRLRAVDYRTRKEESEPEPTSPGQVELAVESELGGLPEAQTRPALAAVALSMARILDNPRAKSTQPPAAKVLVSVLDTLHKGSAQGRRGSLAVVKSMTNLS